jgi:hypothetical protein
VAGYGNTIVKGTDTVNDERESRTSGVDVAGTEQEQPVHHDWASICEAAVDIGEGWRKHVVALGIEDSAHSPMSSKWNFHGPGEITYLIHPSGIDVQVSGRVRKTYKEMRTVKR